MKHSLKKLGCAVLYLAMALTLLPAAALAADETAESGFAPTVRGETLDIPGFAAICAALLKL